MKPAAPNIAEHLQRRILQCAKTRPPQVIATELGLSTGAVNACLAHHGAVAPRRRYQSVEELAARHGALPAGDRRILHLYLDCGYSLSRVASLRGVSISTVHKRLCDWGVQARAVGVVEQKLPNGELELTRWLYEDVGMTLAEVGAALGRSQTAVWTCLRRAGARIRPVTLPSRRTPAQAARVRAAADQLTRARAGAQSRAA